LRGLGEQGKNGLENEAPFTKKPTHLFSEQREQTIHDRREPILELTSPAATIFLREAASLMTAVLSDDDSADELLRPLLARKVAEWERRWNEALALASPEDMAADEWGWLPKVDLALADLVRTHLEPWGYRLQTATLARLL